MKAATNITVRRSQRGECHVVVACYDIRTMAKSAVRTKTKAKPAGKIFLKPATGSEILRSLKLSKAERVYLQTLDVVMKARHGSRSSEVKGKDLKAATNALRKAAKKI